MNAPPALPEFIRIQRGRRTVLVHPEFMPAVADALFEGTGTLPADLAGRGALARVAAPGGNVLIRNYHRGGFAARFLRSHYVLENRPHRELNVHRHAWHAGVPTVMPVGALWKQTGLVFSGSFATREAKAVDLLAYLQSNPKPDPLILEACGYAIRAMYLARIDHADLQVKNILISDGRALIIDFDKARIWPKPSVDITTQNLGRLRRSFIKRNLPMNAFTVIAGAALTSHS